LYTNNFNCPLEVKGGQLVYNPAINWDVKIY